MVLKVSDVITALDRICPFDLAEDWDNSGLQVGGPGLPAELTWVCLDASKQVIDKAIQSQVNLLIAHHPMIFNPLKKIDFSTQTGSIIYKAARSDLSIVTVHTNFDSAIGGINDMLADLVGIQDIKVLFDEKEEKMFKIVVFVPLGHETKVMDALFSAEAGTGTIGTYDSCSFRVQGKGTFKPGDGSEPWSGEHGKINEVDEYRVEVLVAQKNLGKALEKLKKAHPYETPAIDVIALPGEKTGAGLGRFGSLEKPDTLKSLAQTIKQKLNTDRVSAAGDPDLEVKTAAICSGSGGSLLGAFFASGADVYITGDVKFHDAKIIEDAGKGLIDYGHFASEHIAVERLAKILGKELSDQGFETAKVEPCLTEKDPFWLV